MYLSFTEPAEPRRSTIKFISITETPVLRKDDFKCVVCGRYGALNEEKKCVSVSCLPKTRVERGLLR